MGSRGTKSKKGFIINDEYETEFITKNGIKVLKGKGKQNHSLPEFAHTTTSIYGKLSDDGKSLKEIRFFDKTTGKVILELANHPEPSLNNGNREEKVLHYHTYNGLNRSNAILLSEHPEIVNKYFKYIEELKEI